MSDFLKITTPVVNKRNNIQPNKPISTENMHLNLSDMEKIVKTSQDKNTGPQNNTLAGDDKAPSVLINLLKNPSVTVNFLKNIMMLQEIIKLIPVQNSTITEEIKQLFDNLMIKPSEMVLEMQKQENSSTIFKGELFDYLRNIASSSDKDTVDAVAKFLKALNSLISKKDTLDSLSNNFKFMSDFLKPSKDLSDRLMSLSNNFRQSDGNNFTELKNMALLILQEVSQSVFMNPKLEKIIPITIYNLSRFNDNEDFLQDTFTDLVTQINGRENKDMLLALVEKFLSDPPKSENSSKVMNIISKIIGMETNDAQINLLSGEKIDNIIHSLLSSPCNFTPLLHFIIPVNSSVGNSFAEFWIDPDASEEKKNRGTKENIHMLIVFDIEGIGQFESEIFSRDKNLSINLLCPPDYTNVFSKAIKKVYPLISQKGFTLEDINVGHLEKPRSLMDVFKTLPYKRTGVDVKI